MARNTEEKIVKIIADGKQAEASINQITRAVSALNRERNKEAAGSDRYKELTRDLTAMNKKLGDARSEVRSLDNASKKLSVSWKTIFGGNILANIATAGISGLKNLAQSIFDTTQKFQKFEAILRNSLGSTNAAAKAMQDIQKFASETPFTIDGITESYIKLVNRGFVPTMDEMKKLGDLSSTLGKDMDQLVEAILDAQTGEWERLKEFGIRAKRTGDDVAFTFRGVTTEMKFTDEAVKNYILSLGDLTGVQGAMDAQMGTLGGKMSNLSDKLTLFGQKVGTVVGPAIAKIIDMGGRLLDLLGGVSGLEDEMQKAIDSEKQLQEAMNLDLEILKDNNLSQEARKELITEVNNLYGEYLPNLLTEKSSLEEITAAQIAANKAFEKSILLKMYEKDLTEATNKALDMQKSLVKNQIETKRLNAKITTDDAARDITGVKTKDYQKSLLNLNKVNQSAIDEAKNQVNEVKLIYNNLAKSLFGQDINALQISKKPTTTNNSGGSSKASSKSKKPMPIATADEVQEEADMVKDVVVKSAVELAIANDELHLVDIEKVKSQSEAKLQLLRDFEMKKKQLQIDAARQLSQDVENMAFTLMERETESKYKYLLNDLENKRAAELENTRLTEEQKASINEFYDGKRKAIQNEQARKEKELALFRIAIDTGVAAVKALKDDPSGILSALIIAQGLTQAALVAGKEVPQFYAGGVTGAQDGRSYNPQNVGSFAGGGPVNVASMGLIGERGPELVIPNWMYSSPRMASTMMALESMISGGRAFADGGPTTGGGVKGFDDAELKQLLKYNAATMARLNSMLDNGIIANVNWDQVGYDKYLGRREKVKQISEL